MRAPPSSASRARYANTAQCSSGVLPGEWVRVGSTRSDSPSGVREIACGEQRAAPPVSHRECAWQVAMEAECACAGPPPPQFLLPPPPRPPFLRDLTESSCAQSQHPDTCDVVAVLEARWHDDEALLSAVAAAACSLLLVALATAASILLWKYKRKKARAAREGVPDQMRPRPKDSVGLDDEALDADGAAYEDVIQMRMRRAPSNHYTRDHRTSRLHQYAEPLQVKATGSRTKLRRDEEEPHSFVCSLSRDGYGHVYQEIGHGLSGAPSYGEPPCLADERVAGLSGEPRPPTPDLCRHWPGGAPPPPPPRPWSPPPGEPPPPYRTLPRRPLPPPQRDAGWQPAAPAAPAAYACVPLPSYAAAAASAPRSPPLGPPLSPPPPQPAAFATHRRPSDRRRQPPHAAHLATAGRRQRNRDLPPSW
ncbi:uncharacterized protein LOC126267666 [Schistocerca gregaria]|uniref:uncharacterized protein LOC126267666 n=1 Tax=Schistocerca gregaria TaxID=7010 RepID=UPI00211EEE74|nr:uncharacterized protein LOC126267666 [Schistocerca gregaria]